MRKNPYVVAICGAKNSGKTTFIEQMIFYLKKTGRKVAVIKHDGHRFEGDVPGTDSYRFFKAGADSSTVFDDEKYMITEKRSITFEELIEQNSDKDLVILEGGKTLDYPKFEIIRKGNSESSLVREEELWGVISDYLPRLQSKVPIYPLQDASKVCEVILQDMEKTL